MSPGVMVRVEGGSHLPCSCNPTGEAVVGEDTQPYDDCGHFDNNGKSIGILSDGAHVSRFHSGAG